MCYNDTIFITSSTTNTTQVLLTPNTTVTTSKLSNLCTYKLIIACGVKASSSLPVYIVTSGYNIPLLDKYGNNILANQLKTRYCYTIGYGNKNVDLRSTQFIVFNKLCCGCTNTTEEAVQQVSAKSK